MNRELFITMEDGSKVYLTAKQEAQLRKQMRIITAEDMLEESGFSGEDLSDDDKEKVAKGLFDEIELNKEKIFNEECK